MPRYDSRMQRRRRFDDDDEQFAPRRTFPAAVDTGAWDERGHTDIDGPPDGDRWSTWDGATQGPEPRPDWVITDHGAVDSELGVLKTGKEADVHLVERWVPGTPRRVLLAAKRYRTGEHRLFHRDAGYLEGRRVRRSREMRAMANRTAFGRDVLAGQWAGAEFAALSVLWSDGLPVPYPVSYEGPRCSSSSSATPTRARQPRGSLSCAPVPTSSPTCGISSSTPCAAWPGGAGRTVTCRPTTCSSSRVQVPAG